MAEPSLCISLSPLLLIRNLYVYLVKAVPRRAAQCGLENELGTKIAAARNQWNHAVEAEAYDRTLQIRLSKKVIIGECILTRNVPQFLFRFNGAL